MSKEKKRYNSDYIDVLVKLGNISGRISRLEFKDIGEIEGLYNQYEVIRLQLRPFHFDFVEVKKAVSTIEGVFEKYLRAKRNLDEMHKTKKSSFLKELSEGLERLRKVTQEDLDTKVSGGMRKSLEIMKKVEDDPGIKQEVKETDHFTKVTQEVLDIRVAAEERKLGEIYTPLVKEAEESEKIGKDDLNITISS